MNSSVKLHMPFPPTYAYEMESAPSKSLILSLTIYLSLLSLTARRSYYFPLFDVSGFALLEWP
jgi:hypothetical protein